MWLCKCDCGNELIGLGSNLKKHRTKSCGCAKSDGIIRSNRNRRNKDRQDACMRKLYCLLINRHKKYSTEQIISFNKFKELSLSKCHYCGLSMSNSYKDLYSGNNYILHYNGIDRIDSSKGYIEDNVVTCCKHCNQAKMDMSQQDFLNHIKRIYEYNFKGENKDAAQV